MATHHTGATAMGYWSAPQRDVGCESPAARGGPGSVALSVNRLLVFGGADRSPAGFNDLWLLELEEGHQHWTRISPKLAPGQKTPIPRSGCSLTLVNGKVYIFGGQVRVAGDEGYHSGWQSRIGPESGRDLAVLAVETTPLNEPVSGAILEELLVLEVGTWELHAVPASAVGPKRPPARHSHTAGVFERDSLVVFGGAGLRGPMADVWAFNTTTQLWSCLSEGLKPAECPYPREMAAGCAISDAGLFIHGGRGSEGEILSDVAIFDGRAGKWVLIQRTPYPRCAHTASNAVLAQHQPPQPQQQQLPQQSEPATGSGAASQQAEQVLQPAASTAEAGPQAQHVSARDAAGQQQQQQQQPQSPATSSPAGDSAGASQAGAMGSSGSAGAGPGAGSGGAGSGSSPVAANVLLFGGFTGEAVSGDLLQLSFVRHAQAAGAPSLKVELRPVKAALPPGEGANAASPQPRFAHSAVVLEGQGKVEVVVFGGVNQTEDLSDVAVWTV